MYPQTKERELIKEMGPRAHCVNTAEPGTLHKLDLIWRLKCHEELKSLGAIRSAVEARVPDST